MKGTGVASVLDVVASVLAAEQKPLTVFEITDRALVAGWVTHGITPRATVESRLAMDIKAKGDGSRFVRVAPRTYALREWPNAIAMQVKPKAGVLTYLDAAHKVLAEDKVHQPLPYRQITERAIATGYLASNGLTPAQTMYVQLMTDVKRRAVRGDAPRFSQHPKGLFGLAEWSEGDLIALITKQNRKVKGELLDRLKAMHPTHFEHLVGQLLTAVGFVDVVVTKPADDGGVDVFGTLVSSGVVRTRMAVQVKRWKHNIQSPTVQQVRGALGVHDQGLIITTGDFSPGAREEASLPDRIPVALMNGDELLGLLVEHQIGVARANPELLELVEIDLDA